MTSATMIESPPRPLIFLDFEACSLAADSWPVEIGYARIVGGRVLTRATLIAPRPDWPLAAWSAAAAGVHAIPLAAVLAGAPADAVAAETDGFAGGEVVSDNPAWDQFWLDRLRAGRPRIAVRGLRDAMRERLDEIEATAVARALFRGQAAHRAGPDARRLAMAWRAADQPLDLAA